MRRQIVDRGSPLDPGTEQFVVDCRRNYRQREHRPRSGGDRSRSRLARSSPCTSIDSVPSNSCSASKSAGR
jgi:hypothetical protein